MTGPVLRRSRLPAGVALACLLAACAGVPPKPLGPPNQAAWRQRLGTLRTLGDWRLTGRVAIVNGDRGGSGSLLWIEHAPRLEMRFSGPFGIGGFRLYGTPAGVFIDTGHGKTYSADPAHLLDNRLGWPVPIDSLRYWVLGMPAPGQAAVRVDQDGLLRHLQQGGWDIRYRNYTSTGGYRLPARLEAHRGNIKLKLAVEQWTVPAGAVAPN